MELQPKTKSPRVSAWEEAFTTIENAANAYSTYVPIEESDVDGLPPGFSLSTDWEVTRLYRQDLGRDPFTIRELGSLYLVGQEAYHPEKHPDEHAEHDRPRALVSGGLALAGSLLVAGDLLSSDDSAVPTVSLDSLVEGNPELDDGYYDVFLAHAWTADERYARLESFLDDVPELNWQNRSVPSTDALPVATEGARKDALRDQIRRASVVVVSADTYEAHRTWVERELALATKLGKPVVAVVPDDAEPGPQRLVEAADGVIDWEPESLADAIARHGAASELR